MEQDETETIMIVEDDCDTGQFIVEAILQETGYHPLLLNNGFLALKVAQYRKPALFIIDYYLPKMNGLVLYERLHACKILEDVPCLIISAAPLKELEEVMQRGKLALLSKPFELQQFLDLIERLIAGSRGNSCALA